ncbi:MAG: hypothetical protein ACI89P_001518, partial [Colwellia sp.]
PSIKNASNLLAFFIYDNKQYNKLFIIITSYLLTCS